MVLGSRILNVNVMPVFKFVRLIRNCEVAELHSSLLEASQN
jgi:hypothetical protein